MCILYRLIFSLHNDNITMISGLPGQRGPPGVQGPPGFCEFCNYANSYAQAVGVRSGGNTKGP